MTPVVSVFLQVRMEEVGILLAIDLLQTDNFRRGIDDFVEDHTLSVVPIQSPSRGVDICRGGSEGRAENVVRQDSQRLLFAL